MLASWFCLKTKGLFALQEIRLGLNCVGGKETTLMAGLLGHDAHLVTYGAMSKQPVSLPTSLFIFKNLTCHGFWQSRWYTDRSRHDRIRVMKILAGLMSEGKVRLVLLVKNVAYEDLQLKEPEHCIVTLGTKETDEQVTEKVRAVIAEVGKGRYGK